MKSIYIDKKRLVYINHLQVLNHNNWGMKENVSLLERASPKIITL